MVSSSIFLLWDIYKLLDQSFQYLINLSFRVFKRAARINAQRLILVGTTEWQKGMVGVKILSSGEQYEIKLDELEWSVRNFFFFGDFCILFMLMS